MIKKIIGWVLLLALIGSFAVVWICVVPIIITIMLGVYIGILGLLALAIYLIHD